MKRGMKMKVFKKILSVFLTAAIMMSVICIGTVSASAAGIADTAKKAKSGTTYSVNMEKNKEYDYKVNLSKKGNLTISMLLRHSSGMVHIFDKNGNQIYLKINSGINGVEYSVKTDSGNSAWFIDGHLQYKWASAVEYYKSTVTFKNLDKGTYFVRFYSNSDSTGKSKIKFTYPSDDNDSEAKLTAFSITLKKGETLSLGTVMEGNAEVEWSTSKKSVATVSSKGKITAKSKGTTYITAKSGNSSIKIQIKVSG